MAKRTDIKKILIIGSGPIVIGQAAEFDYAGTQACLALKEEGYEVVLVNSNPATIMTDTTIADKVYMEPLTLEYVAKIIRYERPGRHRARHRRPDRPEPGHAAGEEGRAEGVPGGAAGHHQRFHRAGRGPGAVQGAVPVRIGEPVHSLATSPTPLRRRKAAAARIGYPVVLRPAFTLGGTGGGFADDEEELRDIVKNAFTLSPGAPGAGGKERQGLQGNRV